MWCVDIETIHLLMNYSTWWSMPLRAGSDSQGYKNRYVLWPVCTEPSTWTKAIAEQSGRRGEGWKKRRKKGEKRGDEGRKLICLYLSLGGSNSRRRSFYFHLWTKHSLPLANEAAEVALANEVCTSAYRRNGGRSFSRRTFAREWKKQWK